MTTITVQVNDDTIEVVDGDEMVESMYGSEITEDALADIVANLRDEGYEVKSVEHYSQTEAEIFVA